MSTTTDKPRILILLEATLGGTRKHVIDLLENLDATKFEITFGYALARADKNFLDDLSKIQARGNICCVHVPLYREISLTRDLKAFYHCCQLVRRGRFDLVHVHSSKAGFLGRIATKLFSPSTPVIYTPHSLAIHVSPLYGHLERFAARFTDVAIAVSDSERAEMIAERILPNERIRVIPSGVQVRVSTSRQQMRRSLGLSENSIAACSMGRLTWQKNPLLFFEAAARLSPRYPNVRFLWAGDGELEKEVRELIRAKGIENVCNLLGWRTDTEAILAASDIFTLTSRYESFGYVTCEAMAARLPVVATDVTGTRDIVKDGETGYLVGPEDIDTLVERLALLIEMPDQRERLAENGRRRVQKYFSVENMVTQTAAVYRDLLPQYNI